ncbi:MAG: ferritin-like domain-containing protein [Candidatus Cohnella colombiensis]|uniref:Ferritin-like domain-containing protein n=1 Tax=Candidatus Cohnella colombiensis TaxID=3121368 RepID=A0AA95EX30_9BACL|nr:MAG: ferritin-like domain-containing protein [Cohnella sp.]
MYYTTTHPSDPRLINDIVQAINGEFEAIVCYEQLSKLAPTDDTRNQILEIRNDEIRHYNQFSQIYTSITGLTPTPQYPKNCPTDYRAGIQSAFKDEQETVDFYHRISERANNPHISIPFQRAAADEQNHAVWFLFFLTSSSKD